MNFIIRWTFCNYVHRQVFMQLNNLVTRVSLLPGNEVGCAHSGKPSPPWSFLFRGGRLHSLLCTSQRFVGVPFSLRLLIKILFVPQRVLKLTTWQLGNGATWSYVLQSCDATNWKGLQIKVDVTINYLHYALRYVYLVFFFSKQSGDINPLYTYYISVALPNPAIILQH